MSKITMSDVEPVLLCEVYEDGTGISHQVFDFEKDKKKPAMSGAERARLYRERRKALQTKVKPKPLSQTERNQRWKARKAERQAKREEALTAVDTQPLIVPIQEVFVIGTPPQKSDLEPSFSNNPDVLDPVQVKKELETTAEHSNLEEVFVKTEEFFVKDEVMISDDEDLGYQLSSSLVESQLNEELSPPDQDVSPVNDPICHLSTENSTIHLVDSEPECKVDNNVFYVEDSDSDSRDAIKKAKSMSLSTTPIAKHFVTNRYNIFNLQSDNQLLRKKVEVLEDLVYELRKEIWNLKNTTKID